MESFALVDGLKLWTTTRGVGFPVVLSNGGPGCCDYLAPVDRLLPPTVQAIRFEHRGCGRSDTAPSYSLATCVADLEAIRNHYGLERWILCGHSAGADLAIIYALEYPQRVQGLICLSGGRFHNDREWHAIYRQKREQGFEPLPDFAYPFNLTVNTEVNQDWKRFIQRPTLLRELTQLTVPVTFIYGTEDIRPSWPVEQVAHLMPNATFISLPDADHHLWTTKATELQQLLGRAIDQYTPGL